MTFCFHISKRKQNLQKLAQAKKKANVPGTFICQFFCDFSNEALPKHDIQVFLFVWTFGTDFTPDFTVNVSFVLRSHRDRETDFSALASK